MSTNVVTGGATAGPPKGSPTVVLPDPTSLNFTDLFVGAIVEKVVIPRQVLGR